MKKLLLSIGAIALLLVGGSQVFAANTLSEYYNSQGLALPSISERAEIAAELGIWNYRGTAEQNRELLFRLENPPPPLFESQAGEEAIGVQVATRYKTTLESSMTATQTTIPVSSITSFDGTTLTMALLGSQVFLTIEPGSAREEIVKCTAITSSQFSSCTRGLAFTGSSESSVSANRKAHNAGSVVIMSNVHYVFNQLIDNNQTAAQSIDSDVTFTTGTIYLLNNNFGLRSNGTNLQWTQDGFTNSYNFTSSSISQLTASSTAGIGVTNSEIFVNVSSTDGGLNFNADGQLQVKYGANSGIGDDANGIYVERGDNFDWTGTHSFATNTVSFGAGSVTSTPSAYGVPVASSTGKIDSDWINTSTLFADVTFPSVIRILPTSTVSGTSGSDVTFASSTIPGGTLGTDGMIFVKIPFTLNNAATSMSFKMKYGSTTLCSYSFTNSQLSTNPTLHGYLDAYLYAFNNSTSQQYCVMTMQGQTDDIKRNDNGSDWFGGAKLGEAFSTEDSTTDLDLYFTVNHGSASNSFAAKGGFYIKL